MKEIENSNTQQRKFWSEEFGNDYINRNQTIEEVNEFYKNQTGVSVEQIFNSFFAEIDRNSSILELGCNVGLNLRILQKMGFKNIHGLELNKKAIEVAKKNNPNIDFINSSIEDFDSKNQYDLVYTAGVLIHINPNILDSIISKMFNLTRKYIFGFEYYSNTLVEIPYRGHSNVCWKQDFSLLFKKTYSNLKTVKEEKFNYKQENLVDIAYLLKKA